MTKYEDLAKLYHQSRLSFNQYEEECATFARDLVTGFLDYVGWPREQEINFLAVGEEIDPTNKFFGLAGAMEMDTESFWHFGVELRLQEASGTYPLSLVLTFFIKKIEGDFVVKLGPKGREIKIPESKRNQLDPFYDIVYRQINEFLTKHYVQAITGNQTQFGFINII
jgi:hypothetical protein